MSKFVKTPNKLPKAQKLQNWLELATCKYGNRPVLTAIYKNNAMTVAADGYRIHITDTNNDYSVGLNETKSSKKNNSTLEGVFPNIGQVIPKKYTSEFTINTIDLINALQVAQIFARDSAEMMTLELDVNSLIVDAKSAERGDTQVKIETNTIKLDGYKYTFNCRYMLEALKGMKDTREVTISINAEFKLFGDNSFSHGMMKIQGTNRTAILVGMTA